MARTLEDELLLLLSSAKVSQNAEPRSHSFETKKSLSTKLKESLKLFSRGRSKNKVPPPVQHLFKSKLEDNKDEDEQLGFCLDPPRFSCDEIGESKYLCKEPPRRSLDSQLLLKEEAACYEPARRSLDVRMLCKTYFSSENGRGSVTSVKASQKQGTNIVARLMGLEDFPTGATNRGSCRNKLRDLLNAPDTDVDKRTEVASKASWTTRNSDSATVGGPQEQQSNRAPSSILETRKVGDQKRQEMLKQVKAVDDDKKRRVVSQDLSTQAQKVENRHVRSLLLNRLAQVKAKQQQEQEHKKTTENAKSKREFKVTMELEEKVGTRKPWQLSSKIAAENSSLRRTAVVQKSLKRSTDNGNDSLKENKKKNILRPSKEVAKLRDHLRTSSCRVVPEEVSRAPNSQSKFLSSTKYSSSSSQQKSICKGIEKTRTSNDRKARSMVSSNDKKLPTCKNVQKSSIRGVQVPNKPEKQSSLSRTGNSRTTFGPKRPPQQQQQHAQKQHVRDVVGDPSESRAAFLGLRKNSSAAAGRRKEEETSALRHDIGNDFQSSTSLKDGKAKEQQYKQEEMAESCKGNSDNALSPVSVLDAFNKDGGDRSLSFKRLAVPRTLVKVPRSSGKHFTFADIVEQQQEICSDHWMLTDCKVCSREICQRLESTIFDNLVYETIIYLNMHLK